MQEEDLEAQQVRERLKSKALWLQKKSDLNVIVGGYTDEEGSKEYNFASGRSAGWCGKVLFNRSGYPVMALNSRQLWE